MTHNILAINEYYCQSRNSYAEKEQTINHFSLGARTNHNNQAKASALLQGLILLKQRGVHQFLVIEDLMVIIRQTRFQTTLKDPR